MKFLKGHKPLGRALKGHITTEETKKKIGDANRGRKYSVEPKVKMSKSRKGKLKTEEHKKKIGFSNIGKTLGEKNAMKRIDVRAKQFKNTPRGKNHPMWGKKIPKEQQEKMTSLARQATLGKKKSKEHNQKNREWHINNPNRIFQNTKIELLVAKELKKRNINFLQWIPLCNIANVDFLLPDCKIVIQCDGCYWHGCPIHHPERSSRTLKDSKQDSVLSSNGFEVYRFWEHEINKSVKECIDKII